MSLKKRLYREVSTGWVHFVVICVVIGLFSLVSLMHSATNRDDYSYNSYADRRNSLKSFEELKKELETLATAAEATPQSPDEYPELHMKLRIFRNEASYAAGQAAVMTIDRVQIDRLLLRADGLIRGTMQKHLVKFGNAAVYEANKKYGESNPSYYSDGHIQRAGVNFGPISGRSLSSGSRSWSASRTRNFHLSSSFLPDADQSLPRFCGRSRCFTIRLGFTRVGNCGPLSGTRATPCRPCFRSVERALQ